MHIEQARGFESGKVGFQGCMDSSPLEAFKTESDSSAFTETDKNVLAKCSSHSYIS